MILRIAFGALAAAAACLGGATTAWALPADSVDRAERATVLVDVNTSEGRAFGSAFCIRDTGLFVTDGHVVLASNKPIKLVIRPGETDQRVVNAHVLGIDYEADLAVLQADKPVEAPKLEFGDSDSVAATQEITAFGYPFGNMLAMDKDSYPSVTVNSGKVTALRKEKGELALIQVDALVNPGNSGGPVLDGDGRVIGIVESGVPGAGLNFATPVARLKKMLDGPLVLIDPPTVAYAKRNQQQTFSIHVNSLSKSALDYEVEFKITDSKGNVQTGSSKTAGGKCDVAVTPTTDTSAIEWSPFEEAPPAFKFAMTLKQSSNVVGTEQGSLYLTDVPIKGLIVQGNKPHKSDWPKQKPDDPLPAGAQDTPLIGAQKTNEFREMSPHDALAIGVEYVSAETGGKFVLSNLRLLYAKPGTDKDESIVARDGYVLGGLKVGTGKYSTGVFPNGLQVIFIRQKDGVLDTSDTYTSDWAGVTPATGKEKQLAGNGERVIGICGRKGFFVRAIGLVIQNPSGAAATQAAEK